MQLALFDFDGTLTTRDSLMPFVRHCVGPGRFAVGLARMSPALIGCITRTVANGKAKQDFLAHFFRGRTDSELRAWGETFSTTRLRALERSSMLAVFRRHKAAGDVCVLVSASLDVYLQPWAASHGFDACLSTSLEAVDGRLTGRLAGLNCWGPEKARRIREWTGARPVGTVTAYGDSRGDRELLQLANEAFLVGRSGRLRALARPSPTSAAPSPGRCDHRDRPSVAQPSAPR